MVEVQVFGGIWEHLPPSLELDLEGSEVTIADLLARLRIDLTEVGIVTVNGRQTNLDGIVPQGSRVYIFPLISGG